MKYPVHATRDIQDAIREILEIEYEERRTVGNRDLQEAFVKALQSSPVRETIHDALDIFLNE